MSDIEKKEGIVVNPMHHADVAYRRPPTDHATPPQGDAAGNVDGSSEQTSGDATKEQVGQDLQPGDSWTLNVKVKDGQVVSAEQSDTTENTSQSNLTADTDTSASDVSQQSKDTTDGQAAGNEQGGSSDGAGTTPPPTSDIATGSSSSPSTPTTPTPAPIVTGQVVSGNVTNVVATPTPAPAPTFIQKEETVVLNTIQTGITDVDKFVDELMKGASIEGKIIINTIKEYIVKMKPGKPVTQKDGVMNQVAFYNAILNAINNLDRDFRPTLQAILALFHAHKDGAFRETHVFRYFDTIPLSVEHRNGFRKLVTLLKTLAKPETRQDLLRQMNFDPLLKHGLTERGRTKLAAFFGK